LQRDIGDGGAGQLKKLLTEAVNEYFRPLRERRKELEAQPDYIRQVLKDGIAAAREEAIATLEEVREVMNMSL